MNRILRAGDSIAERLLAVAVAVVRVSKQIPRDPGGRHIALQLLRAGTSPGANYEEARGAESRSDFVHKLRIATKELREVLFWMKLVSRANLVKDSLTELEVEIDEMIAILTASARTARQPPRPPTV